jgi:hypothetical protein
MGGTKMTARVGVIVCILAALSVAADAVVFNETWGTAEVAIYVPGDLIDADEGFWFVGDTISEFPECGETPQSAEILTVDGNRALYLLSVESFSDCADDVWIALTEFDSFNPGFGIPLRPGATISFEEVGELVDPQLHDGGSNCLFPPCFDNVSLLLSDNNGNILAYVLQRLPEAVPNVPNENFGDTYREIFLDPEAIAYQRDLFTDFQTIPTFDPAGAEVVYIEFRVDELGWAILDNLFIDSGVPVGTVPVYRFWSPLSGCHFFTADEAERQKLLDEYSGIWLSEGIAFFAYLESAAPDGTLPVYRFWSPVLSSHFYTMDEAERDKLLLEFPHIWTFEGIAFFAFPEGIQPTGTEPVYRFWSPVLGCHFYTINEAERDKLLIDFPHIWTFEGVAWNAFP